MKREFDIILDAISELRTEFINNPESIAPQFRRYFLQDLCVAQEKLVKLYEAVDESEQINSGLN